MSLPRPQADTPEAIRQAISAAFDMIERGEPWRTVGSGANDAVPFQNSWVNFDADRPARFCKDVMGFVHLDGLIKNGTVNTPAFTLPPGYRPDHPGSNAQFASDANSAHGLVLVHVNGTVTSAHGSNAFVTLSGITFRAA